MTVQAEKNGPVTTIIIHRPACRNAVDPDTATALREAFDAFEADEEAQVAVLTGAGEHFCAGFDLKAVASAADLDLPQDEGPMGPTRRLLSKPVIAAVEGYAVAGGLELALWCDLRVASQSAVFGVFCRRWGVPLIDGGTQRLPRLIGASRAKELIFSGRFVGAEEALRLGLVNHVVPHEELVPFARRLAVDIAGNDQTAVTALLGEYNAVTATTIEQGLQIEAQRAAAWNADRSRNTEIEQRRQAI
ncbi:MAG: crotonase/enoyl-CoA hydratase family protein, partial [Pseudomonadota bacterium]|nr:crotonase/enoyl-CoA hydratase family protein [Pseudomonadota bacterium]